MMLHGVSIMGINVFKMINNVADSDILKSIYGLLVSLPCFLNYGYIQ